jgi:hypothetical protein
MFEAVAVRNGWPSRPARITLDRWSNEAERNQVIAAVTSGKSPAEIADQLAKMEAIGSFRTISGLGNEIRYAQRYTGMDGTDRLVLLTDRQVNYWEGANAPKPIERAYTFMEVRFADDAKGGEGKVTHASLAVGDANRHLVFDGYDTAAVGLIGVKQLTSDEEPMSMTAGLSEPIMFEAVAVRTGQPSRPARITLERWSTKAEANQVLAAVAADTSPEQVAEALGSLETIGVFRTISGRSNPIRFAQKYTGADGVDRLVLASDDQINYWEGANAPKPIQRSYTFIEVRFADDAKGGEGKIAHEGVVVGDANAHVTFGNYDAVPVGLIGVKRLHPSGDASMMAQNGGM